MIRYFMQMRLGSPTSELFTHLTVPTLGLMDDHCLLDCGQSLLFFFFNLFSLFPHLAELESLFLFMTVIMALFHWGISHGRFFLLPTKYVLCLFSSFSFTHYRYNTLIFAFEPPS